jgi:hypothetical protein
MVSRVCIWDLRPSGKVDVIKARKYSLLPCDTYPPIECTLEGTRLVIRDGHHRWLAAIIRGEQTVNVVY